MRTISASSFQATYSKSSVLYRSALAAALMVTITANNAFATGLNETPQGGVITSGNGTINNTIPGQTQIDLSTSQSIIDWQSFNIGQNASVNYNMLAGANSVSLNRIHDQNVSQILGSLTANGKLVLVNPNGVFFGAGSRVDVAGLVASTADISNADFLAGKTHFNIAGRPDASIINKGTITAAEGGLVALVAPSVRNDGVIQARSGAIRIGAAETFTVDFYGDNLYSFALGNKTTAAGKDENGNKMDSAIENNGTISAQGGSILLTANAAKDIVTHAVNNKGVIEATSARSVNGTIVLDGGQGNVRVAGKVDASGKGAGEKGGKITVTGKNIELAGATVDASGTNGGGEVRIGGDYQGGGTLAHADYVYLDSASSIDVSAFESGNGGLTVLWSDLATQFDGVILSKGGILGGDGGLVETSSAGDLSVFGNVDASVSKDVNGNDLGVAGSWLLDPRNIIISNAGNSGYNVLCLIGGNCTSTGNDANVKVSSLTTALNLGVSVVLTTGAGGSQDGDITVQDAVNWVGLGSLTLNAADDIFVNANIGALLGSVTLNALDAVANPSNNGVVFNNNASINLGTGNVNVNTTNLTLNGNSKINTNLIGGININNSGVFYSNTANSLNVGAASLTGIKLRQSTDGSIQNAISAVGTTGLPLIGGATLTLGAGTFDQYFTIDQGNFTVTGQGQGVTIIKPTSLAGATAVSNGSPWASQSYQSVILASAPDSTILTPVTVSNLTVDGSLVKNWDTAGLTFYNTDGYANNVTITNGGAFGLYSVADSTKGHSARTLLASNITSSGNLWAAAAVIGDNQTVHILNGSYDGTGGSEGIDLSNGSHGTVTGATVKAGTTSEKSGIVFHGGHDYILTNNTVIGSGYGSVGIVDMNAFSVLGHPSANNITIIGGSVTDAYYGIVGGGGSNWNILGTTIAADPSINADAGIYFRNMVGANTITGTTISGQFTNGITIQNSDNVTASLNTIKNASNAGFNIGNSSKISLLGNILDNNTFGIVNIFSDGTKIIGNSISSTLGNGEQAIYSRSSDDVAISLNLINDYKTGIYATTSDTLNVSGNILTGIKQNGIHLDQVSESEVKANLITAAAGNTGSGIYSLGFNGSNYLGNSYTLNAVTGFGTGIAAIGNGNALIQNNILLNNDTGITLAWGSNNSLIDGNLITGSRDGITLYNTSDNTISKNVLLGVTGDGIRVYGSKGAGYNTNANVYANIVTAAGGAANGIKFDNVTGGTIGDGTVANANVVTGFDKGASVINSDAVNVTGNLFTANNTGVFVDPSTNVSVDHNIILGGTTGVWMLDSVGNSISDNLISLQSGDGVIVENSNGTNVANNEILLVGGNGVRLKNSDDVKVSGNTIVAANDGVSLNDSKRAEVFDNIIGAGRDGIHATNNSNRLNVHGNLIGASNHGVYLSRSDRADVTGNLILAGNDGVHAFRSDLLDVNGNLIVAANDGVYLNRSDRADIGGNLILAGRDGVHAFRSDRLDVTGNAIIAANDGVNTNQSENLTVDGNFILAGHDGVHVVGSNGNAVTNNFIFAGHNGVDFLNSDPLVSGNFIVAANDGVHAVGTNDLLVLNNIIFAGRDGVYANGGNNLLVGGNVILAGRDGVHIANETGFVGVALNLIGAGRDGVHVYNTDGVIVGANVIAAGRDGVHANDTNGLLVVANAILAGRDGVHTTDGSLLGVVANLIIAGHDGVNTNNTDGQLVALNAILAGRDGVHNVNSDAAVIAGNGIIAGRDGVHVENSLFNLVALNGILAGRDGVHVEDSALFAVAGNGILAGRDGVNVDDSIGFLVAGNGIAAKRDGVHVEDSALFAVAGNGILAGRDGVNVDDSIGFLVAGNGIAAKRDGVHVTDSALFGILGNDVFAGRDGVNIDRAAGFLVAGNDINAKRDGVHVDRSALFAVAGNDITAKRDGVNVDDSLLYAVAYNDINAKRDGIHATDSIGNIFVGNTIDAGRDGIYGNSLLGNVIVGNKVNSSGRDGIHLVDSALNLIAQNESNNAGRHGFNLENADYSLLINNTSNNAVGSGFRLTDSRDVLFIGNKALGGGISQVGFDADGGNDNITFISNTSSNNLIGARVRNSDDVRFENNLFADNGIGALIVNTDDTVFSGDIFTGNTLGVDLDNSQRTRLEEVTITTPAGGTGIKIENGSGGTRVRNLTISGGAIGILLDGAGSSMQFEGNNSQFSGMDFYFVLQNAAMAGEVLDASQQFFDGTRAADFTYAQWLAAEAKTIDDESTFPVGDVFYKFFPANLSVRDEEDQKRKGVFRAGLFSYAGRTLNNNIEETPMTFEVRQLGTDLSLLNRTTVNPTTPTGIANFFATLAPAAGGNNTGGAKPGDLAQKLAQLNPSAGGSSKPLGAGASAGGCGNSFLDAGAALNFSIGACQ